MSNIEKQLRAIAEKAERKSDEFYRATMIELGNRIIIRSPVDTGVFRANWQSSFTFTPVTTDDNKQATSINKLNDTAIRLTVDDKFYFSNSLPYAEELEKGSSKQAPTGMVRLSIAEIEGIVETKLR